MTRKECLDKAAECVLQDRASQYGGPEDNFGRIAKFWSTYTGTVLDGIDVAMMMALLKVARIRNNKGYEDGYIDLAGYSACGAELAGAEKAREDATRRWGEEYKKLREQAEGGCCQNGKDHSPEEPEFKPGEKVEALSPSTREGWQNATIFDKEEHANCYRVLFPDGNVVLRPAFYIRHVVKNDKPRPKAEDCEEPEFKTGDAVEWNSVVRSWCPAVYLREFGDFGHCVVRLPDGRERIVSKAEIRKAEANYPENSDSSKRAEGCEELVRNEAEECRDCDGFQDGSAPKECEGCMKTLEADAPQTPRELYRKIIASNPATFEGHTPTGEELAELAEEEKRG